MKRDPVAALRQVGEFLERSSFRNIRLSDATLARAVELSSPERMRQLEKEQAAKWVLTKQTRADKPFVRTATAGGWREILSQQSVAQIENGWGEIMSRLGYQLTSKPVSMAGSQTAL
jgi:hypothetical protein